jgi:DNA-binding NarL/FixJ family response regulator
VPVIPLRRGKEPEPLSPRETEILQMMANGATTREIAEELDIPAESVRDHIARILEKLGVIDRRPEPPHLVS